MNLTIFLASVGAVAVMWHVTTTILIYEALRRRNLKTNFLLLRLMAPKYASRYREITRKETGKTGGLFYQYQYIISINAALLAAIIIIVGRIR